MTARWPRLVLPLIAGLAWVGPAAADEEPVIDVHLHAFSDAHLGGDRYARHPRGLEPAASADALARATVDAMRRNHVVIGIVSDDAEGMDRLYALAPDRIQRWPAVEVAMHSHVGVDAEPSADVTRARLEAGTWTGIGEIGTVYRGLHPSSSALEPFYRLAVELDVPLASHSGISFPGIAWRDRPFRAATGNPLQWEDVLKRHPGLRINLMHAGYPFLDDTLAVLALYPNVYVDTGAIIHIAPPEEIHRYLGVLITAGYGDRILFGSDQMAWPGAIDLGIGVIRSAPWEEAQKRAVLYDNAARFLRLPPELVERHHGR